MRAFVTPSQLIDKKILLAILALLPIALVVSPESLLHPLPRFDRIYGALVLGETLALLSLSLLLFRLPGRIAPPVLRREVRLAGPVSALAILALLGGISVFAYWVAVDLLSGYNSFPAYAFSSYPLTFTIYKSIGLGALSMPDKSRAIGLVAFGVAVFSFVALRAKRGVGVAVKDGVLFFAAPVLIVFELALWYVAPVEMYWHATKFLPWSLDRYLTPLQFVKVVHSPLRFVWGGNIYLLSNWFVLLAASSLLALGVALAQNPRVPARTDELEGRRS
jgi:hypothetical protein